MLQIDYRISPADARRALDRARRAMLRKGARGPTAALLRVVAVASATAFGVLAAMAIGRDGMFSPAAGLAGAIILFWAASFGMQKLVVGRIDDALTADDPLVSGPRRVTLADDGLDVVTAAGRSTFSWSAIDRVERDPRDFWIVVSDSTVVQIPVASIDSATAREFIDEIERRRTPQGPSAPARDAASAPAPAHAPPATTALAAEPDRPTRVLSALLRNLRQGVRLALFRPPAIAAGDATLVAAAALVLAALLVQFGLDAAKEGLDGQPVPWALPGATFFGVAALIGAAYYAVLGASRHRAVELLVALLALAAVLRIGGVALSAVLENAVQGGYRLLGGIDAALLVWGIAASSVAAWRIAGIDGVVRRTGAVAIATVLAVAAHVAAPFDALWMPARDEEAGYNPLRTGPASEQAFYQQGVLLERELAALERGRPGTIDLYFVGAAGYASQDVFMREVKSVAQLFGERFDTVGRSVALINNPKTVMESPLASLTGLRRALARVGSAMNRDEDVLFLFLTSHGSEQHELSLDFWPMRFDKLGPQELKAALDESGIRWRVIVVSACYSGGFVPALADEHTIVITAASADRQSFGCSNTAEFTYFGRAYFDQALRETRSFTAAFERARELVAQREQAEKVSPPSLPQMQVGGAIRAHLEKLEERLARSGAPTVAAPPPQTVPAGPYAELARALAPDALLRAEQAGCKAVSLATGPEWAFQRVPDWFGGMAPGRPQWPRLIAAHEALGDASCEGITTDAWLAVYTQAWQEHLAPAHADATLRFLESEAGRAFAAAYRNAGVAAQRAATPRYIEATQRATERYFGEMRRIQEEAARTKRTPD